MVTPQPLSSHLLQHVPHPLPPRRRRRTNPGQGESSREASAESNDDTSGVDDGDDTASLSAASIGPGLTSRDSFEATSIPSFGPRQPTRRINVNPTAPTSILGRPLPETDGEGEISEGSAGHDGDISSATAPSHRSQLAAAAAATDNSITSAEAKSRPPRPSSTSNDDSSPPSPNVSPKVGPASRHPGHGGGSAPPSWAAAPQGFLSNMTPKEIQDHIANAIAGGDPARTYRIKQPPRDRPVRIYADGVYDLLHYGHMLQLRQCKLAFPSTHLMVGVCSDELVRKYKASPVLTSAERYESVRHCKWVDEVVEDAPWTVDQDFLDKHRIDYVAHDEEPYVSAGSDDVYKFVKSIGSFLPTKRTNGVSTSELLQRIVEGYREGEYDSKFIKLGLPELCSTRNGSEADGTQGSKQAHEEATVDGKEGKGKEKEGLGGERVEEEGK